MSARSSNQSYGTLFKRRRGRKLNIRGERDVAIIPPMASSSSILIPPILSASISRRNLLLSTTIATVSPSPQIPSPDVTITDRVFLDFSLCPTYFRSDPSATLSSTTPCSDSTPLGRVVLGLYGRHVPLTVSTFKLMCTSSSTSYKNTPIHKIFPGQFFLAGRQGLRRDTAEAGPLNLPRNTDVVNSKSFLLPHARPGLVSLCLSENDDDDETRLDPEYRNVEFLITTGPGPCPQLDGGNIVFGTVLEGK